MLHHTTLIRKRVPLLCKKGFYQIKTSRTFHDYVQVVDRTRKNVTLFYITLGRYNRRLRQYKIHRHVEVLPIRAIIIARRIA